MALTKQEQLQAWIEQHPDVAEGVTPEVAQNWIDSQNPKWIERFCAFNGFNVTTFVTAHICWSYEQDEQFKKLPVPGRPPTLEEQRIMYFDRCNKIAELLDTPQPFNKPGYRLRGDYGGPW